MLRQQNGTVTDKQYGNVRTVPHVCWEIFLRKTFTEEEFDKQGKKNWFIVMFGVSHLIDMPVTAASAQCHRGKALRMAGLFANSYLS